MFPRRMSATGVAHSDERSRERATPVAQSSCFIPRSCLR
ncbi:MAG: hypothetical protein OJF58_004556 [Enhydrobacter sp.]|nr:MAG: hypothetical protein OJF58_004556 [Enhydrobacter sp.]